MPKKLSVESSNNDDVYWKKVSNGPINQFLGTVKNVPENPSSMMFLKGEFSPKDTNVNSIIVLASVVKVKSNGNWSKKLVCHKISHSGDIRWPTVSI